MAQTSAKFRFYRGITFRRTFHYYSPAGVDIDLTGKTLTFYLHSRSSGEDVLVLDTDDGPNVNGSELEITDASEGRFTLSVTDEDTTALDFREGDWRITITDGAETDRLAHGPVVVHDS
jgi:hypothetical protein